MEFLQLLLSFNYNQSKTSNEDINFDKIEYSTKNIETILSLNLSIQSYDFREPDHYTFYCRGSGKIDEGQIMFTTSNFRLYDENNKVLSLDKMKELGTMWWDSILKMWSDQKNENINVPNMRLVGRHAIWTLS